MKQKVVTRGIIKQDGKVLLLRRKGGRPTIAGLYELPGGKIYINQQPEDSLERALNTHLGVRAATIQLMDVMTFIDPDDRELQYTFILFQTSIDPTSGGFELSGEYDHYTWKTLTEIQLDEITQSTRQLLGLTPHPGVPMEVSDTDTMDGVKNSTHQTITSYSDGGSRGNPGPSASGYVLLDERNAIIYEGGTYLGKTTNNVAEYTAVLEALQKSLELGARRVDMRMDSQLVANQMNGIYKIKHPDLAVIKHAIEKLSAQFEKVTYTYVARKYNTLADGMVNKILDAHQEHMP